MRVVHTGNMFEVIDSIHSQELKHFGYKKVMEYMKRNNYGDEEAVSSRMFSLRIVDTDHYLATPIPHLDVCHSEFRQADVNKVPVVRIYGATPQGQKTCMHVHGVFPYMYVPADGAVLHTESHLRQFASSIDKALNVALSQSSSPVRHVYKISLVSGIPFYGYHGDEKQFLKIYFFNPLMIKKAADLLLGGAVMNRVFQPHETHIPYRLQLFIDYNLYGMNMINAAAVKFRQPGSISDDNANPSSQDRMMSQRNSNQSLPSLGESFLSNSVSTQRWDQDNITSDLWLGSDVLRQSTCELEVDIVAADILNRQEVGANVGANPGLVALWEDELLRRKTNGGDVTSMKPQPSQDRGRVEWSNAEAVLQDRFRQIICDLTPFIEESDSEGSEDLIPDISSQPGMTSLTPTPSSQVELHLSQPDNDSSQDTVIMEDDRQPPIVSLEHIRRVVSFSQSFRDDANISRLQTALSSQDRCLADMLAVLADDSSAASQLASQIVSSEEHDSILTGISPCDGSNGSSVDNEDETAEMTQVVCEANVSAQSQNSPDDNRDKTSDVEYDLKGMDQSWNSSAWEDVANQNVAQFDGTSDDKQDFPVDSEKSHYTDTSHEKSNQEETNKAVSCEKTNHLGELQILLKEVQKQRVLKSSLSAEAVTKKNSKFVLDLRSPTPVQVHDMETNTDSDNDVDKIAENNKTVARFILDPNNAAFTCVSVSEASSDNEDSMGTSFNASADLFDDKATQKTKAASHTNIFSALSSELSNAKLLPNAIEVEISKDIKLPFNRDHLCGENKDKRCDKCSSPSNASDLCAESDSDMERLSNGSDLMYPKTSCIVPRRPSSESSTTSTDDLHVGPHTFTYDRTAPRKEQPKFAQVLDRNRPFPEILKELEVSTSPEKLSNEAAVCSDNIDNAENKLREAKCESDVTDYEDLLPDQDSTSISENETGLLDMTGCDDPVEIIDLDNLPNDTAQKSETTIRKRGRPPGRPNKKVSSPAIVLKSKKRQSRSPWQMSEDFVQELPPWINSGTDSLSPGDSSDTSYVPAARRDAEKSIKKNRLSLTKKKKVPTATLR